MTFVMQWNKHETREKLPPRFSFLLSDIFIFFFFFWNYHHISIWKCDCLMASLVIGRLQRSPGWGDMEYGARELWQFEVSCVHTCSSRQHLACSLSKDRHFLIYPFCSRPVHGLIFLFKWQPGEEPAGSIVQDSRLDQLFFAKQACYVRTFTYKLNVVVTQLLWREICDIKHTADGS